MLTRDWDRYDTRQVVFQPARLTPEALKEGYDWAYKEFYRWGLIARASLHHGTLKHQAKHFFYASGWKKFEPVWDLLIRSRQLNRVTPLLEGVLSRLTGTKEQTPSPVEASLLPVLQQENGRAHSSSCLSAPPKPGSSLQPRRTPALRKTASE